MVPPLPDKETIKRALVARIEALVEESTTLARSKENWGRHVEIQAEIMRLCRETADLFADTKPYWMSEDRRPPADEAQAA